MGAPTARNAGGDAGHERVGGPVGPTAGPRDLLGACGGSKLVEAVIDLFLDDDMGRVLPGPVD